MRLAIYQSLSLPYSLQCPSGVPHGQRERIWSSPALELVSVSFSTESMAAYTEMVRPPNIVTRPL